MSNAKLRVLIADDMSSRSVEILSQSPLITVEVKTGLKAPELKEALKGVTGLVVRSATKVTADILESAPDLKIIGRAGIGVDNIDVKAASRRGVIVMNTPSGNAVTTAEHALFLLCSLARHIPQATASMKSGKWDKKKYQGTELFEKTLGVLGLGNIGRIVADRAKGLKMKVIAYDPFLSQEAAENLGVELLSLDEVYKRADMITVHVPMTDDTKGMVNAAAFAKMKKGVLLVNAARGGIVDEKALLEALNSGKVAGAALDVFEKEPVPEGDPLVAHERVICTPHLGASTDEAQEKVAIEVAEQFVAYFTKSEIKNAVNLPAMSPENQGRVAPWVDLASRLGAMVAQLTSGVQKVEVELVGDVMNVGGKALGAAALAGLLKPALGDEVNQVNARLIATERGVQLTESVRSHGGTGNFTSSIAVKTTGNDGERYVKGTVFQTGDGVEPRIVQIDRFLIEAVPEGKVLVLRNQDKPGVIGSVGTLLGSRGINVSRMQVGLDRQSKEALQLWNVDAAIDAATVDAVRQVPGVTTATVLSF